MAGLVSSPLVEDGSVDDSLDPTASSGPGVTYFSGGDVWTVSDESEDLGVGPQANMPTLSAIVHAMTDSLRLEGMFSLTL